MVDVNAVIEAVKRMPGVVHAADLQYSCSEAQTFIDVNKEKYEKDRAAFETEQAKARERLEKANK